MTCRELFKDIAENSDPKKEIRIGLEALEIYNETIRDLMVPPSKSTRLKVHQHPKRGAFVPGLKFVPLTKYDEIDFYLRKIQQHRTVASTQMNQTSSRGHTVFSLTYTIVQKDAKVRHGTSGCDLFSILDH